MSTNRAVKLPLKKIAFPSWAPDDVIARWREEKKEADAGYKHNWVAVGNPKLVAEYRERAFQIPDLLYRLVTDDDMRRVWERITRAGNISGDIPHTTIFAASVIHAWMGPMGGREQLWSAGARAKWQQDVAVLAERLAVKLQGTGADDFLNRTFLHDLGARYDMSDLLRSLARHARDVLKSGVPAGHRHSPRAYFVRHLTQYFREYFGGPNRTLVAKTAAVAFNDDAITERQVRRIAPGR